MVARLCTRDASTMPCRTTSAMPSLGPAGNPCRPAHHRRYRLQPVLPLPSYAAFVRHTILSRPFAFHRLSLALGTLLSATLRFLFVCVQSLAGPDSPSLTPCLFLCSSALCRAVSSIDSVCRIARAQPKKQKQNCRSRMDLRKIMRQAGRDR